MSDKEKWEKRYEANDSPWDTGLPDTRLMALVSAWPWCSGKVLEVGCGTGTNAVWLAEQGFQVVALDISSKAIALSKQRAAEKGVSCTFLAEDFLSWPLEQSQFAFLFDRGCFHLMDGEEKRRSFAAQAAACLAPGGLWLSLIGNKDQSMEGTGPPRLSAAQICAAVESDFEILELKSSLRDSSKWTVPLRFWQCLMRLRHKEK